MYLRQLLEGPEVGADNLTTLKSELKDFLRSHKDSNTHKFYLWPFSAVAMLLYSYNPKWYFDTIKPKHPIITLQLEKHYPTSIPIDKIVQILKKYKGHPSATTDEISRYWYELSDQEKQKAIANHKKAQQNGTPYQQRPGTATPKPIDKPSATTPKPTDDLKLTSLKKELKDFLRTVKDPQGTNFYLFPFSAVAMLLYSYDPNWFVTTFNDNHFSIRSYLEESYPTSIPVDKIVQILQKYEGHSSADDHELAKYWYGMSDQEKQKAIANHKEAQQNGTQYQRKPSRSYGSKPSTSTPKPSDDSNEYKIPQGAIDFTKPAEEYSIEPLSGKAIATGSWTINDIPPLQPAIPLQGGKDYNIGSKVPGDYEYDAFSMWAVGVALGGSTTQIFNRNAKTDFFWDDFIDAYPGNVDINHGINEWNRAVRYVGGSSSKFNPIGSDELVLFNLNKWTDIPRYTRVLPDMIQQVQENYKKDQEAAARGEKVKIQRPLIYSAPSRPGQVQPFSKDHWVTFNMSVFKDSLKLMADRGIASKLNTLEDPILTLGLLGDPRMKKDIDKIKQKYGPIEAIDFDAMPYGFLGIYSIGRSKPDKYGNIPGIDIPYDGSQMGLTLLDRAFGLEQTSISKTLAHELRHRAFNIMFDIEELRNMMPADLREGGEWWGSWGGYYEDHKTDEGATAEHAMLYAMDWGLTPPERRMGFFNNAVFTTDTHPIQYWHDLYEACSKAVGEYLKKVGVGLIDVKNDVKISRPDTFGDDVITPQDTRNQALLNLTPGLPELFRHIVQTDQLDALEAVEDAGSFYDLFLVEFFPDILYKGDAKHYILSPIRSIMAATKYGDFKVAYAHAKNLKRRMELVQSRYDRDPESLGLGQFFDNEDIEKFVTFADEHIAALEQFKDIQNLSPDYFSAQLASGQIEPASLAEVRAAMPYSMWDLADYSGYDRKEFEDPGAQPPEDVGLAPTPASDEPIDEPDEPDEPIDEPDEPDEPQRGDDPEDIPYSYDELYPIPYYISDDAQIDDIDNILTFLTTNAFLSRLVSGKINRSYEIQRRNIQWPGNHDLDKVINFYNYWISNNPDDYRSQDLPKRINDKLRRELRQKYAKVKREGTAT